MSWCVRECVCASVREQTPVQSLTSTTSNTPHTHTHTLSLSLSPSLSLSLFIPSQPTVKTESDERRRTANELARELAGRQAATASGTANTSADSSSANGGSEVPDVPLQSNIAVLNLNNNNSGDDDDHDDHDDDDADAGHDDDSDGGGNTRVQRSKATVTRTTVPNTDDMALSQQKGWLKLQNLNKSRSKVNLFGSGQYVRRYVILQVR